MGTAVSRYAAFEREVTMVYRHYDLLAVRQCEDLPSVVDEFKMIAVAFEGEGGASYGYSFGESRARNRPSS